MLQKLVVVALAALGGAGDQARADYFVPGQAPSTRLLFVDGRFELALSAPKQNGRGAATFNRAGSTEGAEAFRTWTDRRGRTIATAGDMLVGAVLYKCMHTTQRVRAD